jgi:hypothetical protein
VRNIHVILKVSGSGFEVVGSLEMYIIYCIALVGVIMRYILLREDCLVISATLGKPKSATVAVCSAKNSDVFALLLKAAENPGVLASPSCLCELVVSRSYKHPPFAKALSSESINMQDVLAEESCQSKDAYANWFCVD